MRTRRLHQPTLPLFDGTITSLPDTIGPANGATLSAMRQNEARILLVDDDEATLEALTEAIGLRLGHATVHRATSSLAAIQQVRADSYDLVVSDILMPGTDGLGFLKEVQEIRPDLPVILVTGHPEREEAALYGGAYAFLEKPLNITRLISVMRAALDRRPSKRRDRQEKHPILANEGVELYPAPSK